MIKIEKYDEAYIRILSTKDVEQELSDFFRFRMKGYQYTPEYKNKLWDGYVRLYNLQTKLLYAGLLSYVYKFAESRDYEIVVEPDLIKTNAYSIDDITKFCHGLNLSAKNTQIQLRDYQIDAVHTALRDNRTTLLSPTSSGKSAIIYSIIRWHLNANRKILLIVPNTGLVEQMYNDFKDYSHYNGFDVDSYVQKLYSGFTKEFTKNVLISTWQSLVTIKTKGFFKQFECAIVDECHLAKAKSISSIMANCSSAKYRIGATGTIDDSAKVNKLTLEGLFGPIYKVTTTKELMDQKSITELKIQCLVLKYDEQTRKMLKGTEYRKEIDWIIENPQRNLFIRNLALTTKGNTLVLFNFVDKHGKKLYESIKAKAHDSRPVYYIHGGVDTKDREDIRNIVQHQTDAIIVASLKTLSTGTNIPSIRNIIFAHPTKSKITNLQSIGRGLRLDTNKSHCTLFDICDDLHWKSWKNTTLSHAIERYKIYAQEQFNMKVIEIELGNKHG